MTFQSNSARQSNPRFKLPNQSSMTTSPQSLWKTHAGNRSYISTAKTTRPRDTLDAREVELNLQANGARVKIQEKRH